MTTEKEEGARVRPEPGSKTWRAKRLPWKVAAEILREYGELEANVDPVDRNAGNYESIFDSVCQRHGLEPAEYDHAI